MYDNQHPTLDSQPIEVHMEIWTEKEGIEGIEKIFQISNDSSMKCFFKGIRCMSYSSIEDIDNQSDESFDNIHEHIQNNDTKTKKHVQQGVNHAIKNSLALDLENKDDCILSNQKSSNMIL